MLGGRLPRWPDLVLTLGVTLLVLGPVLFDRGFVLVGDMVFVPDQPWKDTWTGGDGGVPRAVPGDAIVSLLTTVVTGELLQRLVLAGTFIAAGAGMSRLTRNLPFLARAAGIVLFLWNPYVHERLAIGHWALLCGYAALPWVADAVATLRSGEGGRVRRRAWAVLVVALAVAGWGSPTGGVLTTVTALVLALGQWRTAARVLGLGLFVNLPWIVPAFGNGADQLPPDAFGVEAFASSSDTPFGVVGSLLTFGGIWKESIVPADRGDLLSATVGLALVLVAAYGWWASRRAPVLPWRQALALGLGSVLVAAVGGVGPLQGAVEWCVLHVPGGGLLRDGQKWVAPWVLVASVGLSAAVARLAEWSTGRSGAGRAWLVCFLLAPVAALPSFALGLGGFLHSDEFPAQWHDVRAEMERLDVDDDLVVVLPFSTYRRFDWTPRTILDPAPRFFPGQMVTEDALTVPEGTVGGESALAARVRGADDADELADVLSAAGVRWALVHRSTEDVVLPAGAQVVAEGDQLTLLRLREPTGDAAYAGEWRPVAYAVLDLLVLCGTAGLALRLTRR